MSRVGNTLPPSDSLAPTGDTGRAVEHGSTPAGVKGLTDIEERWIGWLAAGTVRREGRHYRRS